MYIILHGKTEASGHRKRPAGAGQSAVDHLLFEMLNGVTRLFMCELLSVLTGELLLDDCQAHVHGLLVWQGH